MRPPTVTIRVDVDRDVLDWIARAHTAEGRLVADLRPSAITVLDDAGRWVRITGYLIDDHGHPIPDPDNEADLLTITRNHEVDPPFPIHTLREEQS